MILVRLTRWWHHIKKKPKDLSKQVQQSAAKIKTTFNIDDKVMAELKREAARQGCTMSEMVEAALRLLLRSHRKRGKIANLPTFRSGGPVVDIADRDALYQAMEGRCASASL
jgi:Ribbon-helix-helix protein, copG family